MPVCLSGAKCYCFFNKLPNQLFSKSLVPSKYLGLDNNNYSMLNPESFGFIKNVKFALVNNRQYGT